MLSGSDRNDDILFSPEHIAHRHAGCVRRELDFADLLTLFTHMNSPEVQNNAVDFDYNSNGLVDMADIVALFDMMIAMFPPS